MTHPAAGRIIDLYERHADTWAALRGDVVTEQFALDLLLDRLTPGATVLDIGCGSGRPIARSLLEMGLRVTGIDSSQRLISIARRDFPDAEWIVGDMRDLDLARRFDAVLAWYSLFHLAPDDQRRMFARFAGHAAPGGLLLFPTGHRLGELIGEWQGEPLYHGSLDPAEYRALLDDNGFDLLVERPHEPERGSGISWLAQKRSSAR